MGSCGNDAEKRPYLVTEASRCADTVVTQMFFKKGADSFEACGGTHALITVCKTPIPRLVLLKGRAQASPSVLTNEV